MSATPNPLQPSDTTSTNVTTSAPNLDELPDRLVPEFIAHWVVKTARSTEMIEWYGHVFGARVVYVESFTRIDKPSLSLRLIAPFADRVYAQWPELRAEVPKARSLGSVFVDS